MFVLLKKQVPGPQVAEFFHLGPVCVTISGAQASTGAPPLDAVPGDSDLRVTDPRTRIPVTEPLDESKIRCRHL